MAYPTRYRSRRGRWISPMPGQRGMGATAADLAAEAKALTQTVRQVAGPGLSAAAAVAADPALYPFVQRLQTLAKLTASSTPAPKPGQPKPPAPKGVGLGAFLPLMDAVIATKRHPWLLPVGIVAAIGIPLALGYTIGSRRRRS